MFDGALRDHPWPVAQWTVVLVAALVAALNDLRSRRIPNLLTLPLFATGVTQAYLAAGTPGLFDSLIGCAVAGLPYVLLFLFAGGGAGDAKLMGALGAWLGLANSLALLLCVNVAGIVFGLLYARRHGRLREVLTSISGTIWTTTASVLGGGGISQTLRQPPSPPLESPLKMPYGVAIFLGALLATGSLLL
jgi:prepilin peptidase CpaA